jgi:cation transport regulator ChaC
MIGFIIRCIVAALTLGFNTYLFYSGSWGWGIFMIFISALVVLSFFRNENMILALNQMRTGNTDKALKYINRITHPQFMPRKQHAYILFLQAVMGAQQAGMATNSENKLRKAIGLGLRKPEDNAMARMHLAGICAQTGRKKEALSLLSEAKKLDNTGMMKDQIRTMQQQLQMAPSKNQMRMAQMMGGRKKSPKMR